MEGIERVFAIIDQLLDTKRKRHIAGGILMSVSMLFGGLALTVITLKLEGENQSHEKQII